MDNWIVHKFGGSSVADAACFRRVAAIVEASSNPREAVVLSACRGVTDALLLLVALAEKPDGEFLSAIDGLKRRHLELAASLISERACAAYREQLERDCRDIAGMLQTVRLIRSSTYPMRDVISGYGEIWSTRLFTPYLRERARIKGEVLWIDARDDRHRRMGVARARCSMDGERGESSAPRAAGVHRPADRDRIHCQHRSREYRRPWAATAAIFPGPSSAPCSLPRKSSSGPMSTACCRPIRGWCRTPRSSISCRTTRPWSSPTSAPRSFIRRPWSRRSRATFRSSSATPSHRRSAAR